MSDTKTEESIKRKKNWSSSSITPPPNTKYLKESNTPEYNINMAAADSPDRNKMLDTTTRSKEDKIELISVDIQDLKANVSSVLQKLELYLAKDETRATEIQRLSIENQQLKRNVTRLEGLTTKMQDQIDIIHKRLLNSEQAITSKNVVMSNVDEVKSKAKEDCEQTVKTIMISEMKIPQDRIYTCGNITGDIKIDSAYRLGKRSRFSRPLVVKFCDTRSKKIFFSYVQNLKGTKINISDDLPSEMRERRISQIPVMKDLKLKSGRDVKISMIKDQLIVDGKVRDPQFSRNKLKYGQCLTQLKPVNEDQYSMCKSTPDGKNSFTAFACEISSQDEACRSHESLFQLAEVAKATHRVYAYALEGERGSKNYGHDDDAEFGASTKILQKLNSKGIVNYYVCITRSYGGKMGKARFDTYEELATQALSAFFPELA